MGGQRRATLLRHLDLYATLYSDETTCSIWANVVAICRRLGRPVQTADAWIAASARQWGLPVVTADVGGFEAIPDLSIVPIRWGYRN
jgi:predicted nucleic acid-binding protein